MCFAKRQRGKEMKNKKSMKKILILVMALVLAGCSNGTSAKNYYKEGITALEDGQYEAAEEAFHNAIEKNKEKSEYYIAYGMALTKTGKYDEAQEQFDKAILDKNNKIVRENNKQAYRGKGIAYLEAEQYEEAIENFETALNIAGMDDLNVDIMFYLAEANKRNGDYEGAVFVYNNIEKIEKSVILYAKRAEVNMELEQYDAAGNDFDRAIGLDKSRLSYYLEKYFMLIKAGKTEEAKKWIDTASAVEVKDEENKVYAAVIQYYQGAKEKAIAGLTELEQNNNILASYYLGNIYMEEEEFEKAEACYETYVNGEENQTEFLGDVYESLAQCYVRSSEYEKAVILLEKAVALEKGKIQKKLLKTLVAVYEKNLQFDKALQTAEKYLNTYPKDKEMKREHKFLQSRVEKADDSENSTQTEGMEGGENVTSDETAVPGGTVKPEETKTSVETMNPNQTSETNATPSASDSGNSGKPDIVE